MPLTVTPSSTTTLVDLTSGAKELPAPQRQLLLVLITTMMNIEELTHPETRVRGRRLKVGGARARTIPLSGAATALLTPAIGQSSVLEFPAGHLLDLVTQLRLALRDGAVADVDSLAEVYRAALQGYAAVVDDEALFGYVGLSDEQHVDYSHLLTAIDRLIHRAGYSF